MKRMRRKNVYKRSWPNRKFDVMNFCVYKFETLLTSSPIVDLEAIDDIRSKIVKISEYMAKSKFLIKQMKFMGIEDEDTHTENLDRMTQFINEGNAKMKCMRDLEYNVREKKKY